MLLLREKSARLRLLEQNAVRASSLHLLIKGQLLPNRVVVLRYLIVNHPYSVPYILWNAERESFSDQALCVIEQERSIYISTAPIPFLQIVLLCRQHHIDHRFPESVRPNTITMSVYPTSTLQKKIDRGNVCQHSVKIDIQTLLNDLCRNQYRSAWSCLACIFSEQFQTFLLSSASLFKREPGVEEQQLD